MPRQMTELQGVAGVRAEGFPSATLSQQDADLRLLPFFAAYVSAGLRRSHSCLDAVG